MLLYWGMFTIGFYIGAIFSFILFARKKLDEQEPIATKQPLDARLSSAGLTFSLKTQIRSSGDKTKGQKSDQIPQPDRQWPLVN